MIDVSPTTEQRVTCSVIGPRNDYGREKLVATITVDGLHVWCRHCRAAHLIERAVCIAAWERGESVIQCGEKN